MRFRMDPATLFLLKAFDMNQFKERLGNLIKSLIRSQNQKPLAINRTRPDVDPQKCFLSNVSQLTGFGTQPLKARAEAVYE